MGHSIGAAHDPSAPAGHLPGFAREEIQKRFLRYVNTTVKRDKGHEPLALNAENRLAL